MSATWTDYRGTIGDRSGLFAQIRERWSPSTALYPGSYVDLSPSTAIPSVLYVDMDRRAQRFFSDEGHVAAELAGRTLPGAGQIVRFVHGDYTAVALPDTGFDLLISLYAGLVWDGCRRHLRPGGLLLANTSHGDACVAALDPDLKLVATVHSRGDVYRLDDRDLDSYLVPKDPAKADADAIRQAGRAIGYTRTAFAYLFQLG